MRTTLDGMTLTRSLVFGAVALGLAGCAPPPPPPPPGDPPIEEAPLRIYPSWALGVDQACTSLFDHDADGTDDERWLLQLDDRQRAARSTGTDATGTWDEVFFVTEDGLVRDDEHVSITPAGEVVSYGNTHHYFDADGRPVRDAYEGGDGRIPIAELTYHYDDNGLLIELVVTSQMDNVVDDRRDTYTNDESGAVVRWEVDYGDDGSVDVTVEYATEAEARSVTVVTTTLTDADGRHVTRTRKDAEGRTIDIERDDDDDGVADYIQTARLEGDRLQGYDADDDGDGETDLRAVWTWDEPAQALEVRLEDAGGVIQSLSRFAFACWTSVVERGDCAEPFAPSEAFGCARFAPAPALDRARAAPLVSVADGSTFLIAHGYAGWELGSIAGFHELLDVDGDDPQRVLSNVSLGLRAGAVDPSDGTIVVAGGIVSGNSDVRIDRIGLDGVTTRELGLLDAGRYAAQAAIFEGGFVLVVGGFGGDGAVPTSETIFLGSSAGAYVPQGLAPYHASLVVLDANLALYAGGDDGNTPPTPVDVAGLFDLTANTWEAFSLPAPLSEHAAVALGGGALLLGGRGAQGPVADVLFVDAAGPATSPVSPLPVALARPAPVALPDGRVFVAGGESPAGATDRTFVYDPSADAWTEGPRLRVARSDARALVLQDGRIAVLGGLIRVGQATAAVDVLQLP